MIKIIVILLVLISCSPLASAANIDYEIYDTTQDANKLIAQGSKQYSFDDIEVDCDETNCKKVLFLTKDYGIGASVYQEPTLTGFGIWATNTQDDFSWEWFNKASDGKFKKLQEGGMVTVKVQGLPAVEEIAEIIFDTDISLRLNESCEAGTVTKRILIKKGSILKITP